VLSECQRRGHDAVVSGCVGILEVGVTDPSLLYVLAGPAAGTVLGRTEGGPSGYWPRVWALRGLLYAWSDEASDVVVRSLGDESWRAREMAAKVVAKQHVGAAFDAVCELRADPVVRVQLAAGRAVELLSASGA
jgi:HEAT repeat protein